MDFNHWLFLKDCSFDSVPNDHYNLIGILSYVDCKMVNVFVLAFDY